MKKEFYDYYINMEPMKYYHTKNKEKEDVIIEDKTKKYKAMTKYDGYWHRSIVGDENVVLIQSRTISKVTGTYGNKTGHVPHIAKELADIFPAGSVVLGELCFDDFESTSRQVGSILQCKAPKAVERQEKKRLVYRVFDLLAYGYEKLDHLSFEERFNKLKCVLEHAGLDYVKLADYQDANFLDMVKNIWSQGGEGIMLIHKDAPYRPGKRKAWESLKIKKSLGELEGKIVGILEPTKEYYGKEINTWQYWHICDPVNCGAELGHLGDKPNVSNYTEGTEIIAVTKPYFYGWKIGVEVEYQDRRFKITSGLTDDDRQYLSTSDAAEKIANGELYAVFTGMQVTEDSIRHPQLIRLRDDV